MGSVIENEKTKEKCQTFTPDDIVKTMLDHVGYIDSLYGKMNVNFCYFLVQKINRAINILRVNSFNCRINKSILRKFFCKFFDFFKLFSRSCFKIVKKENKFPFLRKILVCVFL